MKICAACCIELPRDKFSKTQWHSKKHRRCIECIYNDRECILLDKVLFKQPSRKQDCPICFVRLPLLLAGSAYMACCGKVICSGCVYAVYDKNGNTGEKKCPFCRIPIPYSVEEAIKRIKKRVKVGDAVAMHQLGCYYSEGRYGLPQDYAKALELWYEAVELGNAEAYINIGYAYIQSHGVERNEKKAIHYWELAAVGGVVEARYNLGIFDKRSGNVDTALKHFMIAVESGDHESLKMILRMYSNGHATKYEYAKALGVYQAYLKEIKSDQRDAAAAFENNHYY